MNMPTAIATKPNQVLDPALAWGAAARGAAEMVTSRGAAASARSSMPIRLTISARFSAENNAATATAPKAKWQDREFGGPPTRNWDGWARGTVRLRTRGAGQGTDPRRPPLPEAAV